jgi:hypothetical protein
MMPTKPLYYLSTPYSHPQPGVRLNRREMACYVVGQNILYGDSHLYSPVAHNWRAGELCLFEESMDPYREFNFAMIARCDGLWVYCMEGWQTSKGIKEEVAEAQRLRKPVSLRQFDANTGLLITLTTVSTDTPKDTH